MCIYIYIYTSIPLRPTFYNYFSGEYRQTDKQSAQILRKQNKRNIYFIMRTMYPPGYQQNGFVATHALGHMMYNMCPSA